MDEAATARRPRVVLIAMGLLWVHLVIVVANYFMFGWEDGNSYTGRGQTLTYTLGLMLIGTLVMLVIRNIGRGENWARLLYLPLLGVNSTYAWQALSNAFEMRAELAWRATNPWPRHAFHGDEPFLVWMQYTKQYVISDFITAAQGVLLAAAVLLLFTPSANRWFQSSG